MKIMKLKFESLCAKEYKEMRKNKPHGLPIYAASSFVFENIQEGIDIFKKEKDGHVYSRYANPTVETVEVKLASLESFNCEIDDAWAIMTNSGMSAINTLICSLVKRGEKILTQGNLYGGTTELFQKVISQFGIESIFIDLNNRNEIEAALQAHPEIKLIYFETPANPTLTCIDFSMIKELADQYKITTVVDNTFQTPYLQQPFKFGIDYVIHSTTKFLNGHGNSISGAIIGQTKEGREKVWNTFKLMGSNCSPFEAWILNSGLKTLPLRMDKHCANAMELALFLSQHSKVKTVNYPGLSDHTSHTIAKKQMSQFGGMLSFEIDGGVESGIKFMDSLQHCTLAPTLGDVDTLILHPASSSHVNVEKSMRLKNGITDGMIRVSVGIESSEDIIADLDQALSKI